MQSRRTVLSVLVGAFSVLSGCLNRHSSQEYELHTLEYIPYPVQSMSGSITRNITTYDTQIEMTFEEDLTEPYIYIIYYGDIAITSGTISVDQSKEHIEYTQADVHNGGYRVDLLPKSELQSDIQPEFLYYTFLSDDQKEKL